MSLRVPDGEVIGLIGPNGAGKTTLFNCISGLIRPQRGVIEFDGQDLTAIPPHQRAISGIGRTFQNIGLCKGESVMENLLIAQHHAIAYRAIPGMIGIGTRAVESNLRNMAEELLEMFEIGDYRSELVRDLPVGIAKMVELACALSSRPRLLLLDEPSSGLGTQESDHLRSRLLAVKEDQRLSILMVGHDMRLVMSTASYIYVLGFGRIISEGAPQEVRDDPKVRRAYLGSEVHRAKHWRGRGRA